MLAMAKRRKESTPESRARAKAKARRTRARLTPAAARRGLSAEDVALPLEHEDIAPVVVLVRKAGGAPLGAYREPLGGRPLLLASLPFAAVQPTPFQRDLSPTHARREPGRSEASFAAQFESAELLTLGLVYEEDLRFGGGAYSPMLKEVDRFTTRPLPAALREREGYARRLRAIDVEVKRIVARLQARGMRSPYLRTYVVARINPVRFHKVKAGDSRPAMPIGQTLVRMMAAAKKFDLDKVNPGDLAFVAAGAEGSE